jgi:hypothetical protein
MFFLFGFTSETDDSWEAESVQSDTTLPQYEPKDPELPEYAETMDHSNAIPLQEISTVTTEFDDTMTPSVHDDVSMQLTSSNTDQPTAEARTIEKIPSENEIEVLDLPVRDV